MLRSMKFFLISFTFIAITLLPVRLSADDQAWLNNSLSFTISKNLNLKFTNEARYNEITYMDPYLKNFQTGVVYKLPKSIYIAFLYKRENTKKTDYTLNENRYTFETGWEAKLGNNLNIDTRFRTEIRRYEKGLAINHLRFRFRIRLKTTLKIGSFQLKPFIATEPFGDTIEDRINQNRFYLGTIFPLDEKVQFVINYIRQDTRNKETIHILNSGFNLKF